MVATQRKRLSPSGKAVTDESPAILVREKLSVCDHFQDVLTISFMRSCCSRFVTEWPSLGPVWQLSCPLRTERPLEATLWVAMTVSSPWSSLQPTALRNSNLNGRGQLD